jgi:hypothetical protein
MQSSRDDTPSLAPGQIIKHLLDLGLPRSKTDAFRVISEGFEIHYFDFSSFLKIRWSHFGAVVFSRKPPRSQNLSVDDVNELLAQAEAAIANQAPSSGRFDEDSFFLLIQTANLPPAVRAQRSVPRYPGFVVLDASDCHAILQSAQRSDALRAISKACALALGALQFSPYIMGAPAVGYRFFGRQSLLKRIRAKAGASFTLIGTRRIGKTSLLHELKLQFARSHSDLLVAYLYGSNLDNTYEVLVRIIEDTFHTGRVARVQLDRSEKDLANDLRKLVQSGKHRLAIFIDEFDHILDWDAVNNFRLLNLLRELSYNDTCSFCFAGFRQTLKAVEDVNNPLYNFTSPERIQPFQRPETFEMVESPMENLGVPVTTAGLADLIHRESGGQPELIQYMCNKVLEIFSETNRVVTPDELSGRLTLDGKFESTIFRQFTQNLPQKGLLSVLLFMRSLGENADTANATFTAAELIRGVQGISTNYSVDIPLEYARDLASDLEIAGVITRTGNRAPITYRFTVPRLGDYFMAFGLDNEIRRLAQLVS